MRNEHNYPYSGPDRSMSDSAAQRRGEAWRPGDPDRRGRGRGRDETWRDGGDEGPPFPRREAWNQAGAPDLHRTGREPEPGQDFRAARDLRDAGPGMNWERSGALRQGYGDYGNRQDERYEQQAWQANAGNEPHPYSAFHRPHPQGAQGPLGPQGTRRHGGRPPKGYTRSDERIREDVCEHLMADPSVDAGEVSVEVKEGVVTLEGSVPERHMRYALESVAAACLGVKDVDNRVKVAGAAAAGSAGSQAAQAYSTAQDYARSSREAGRSRSGPGMGDASVSDTHGLGGDQSRFIRPHTD